MIQAKKTSNGYLQHVFIAPDKVLVFSFDCAGV